MGAIRAVTVLRKDLKQYWPNLHHRRDEKADSHFEFWEDEWRKHGSCSGLDPATYFRLAIQFRKRSNLLYVLGKEGFVPGRKLYLPDEIKSAIEKAWSTTPQLKCNMDLQQDPQLVETVLCIQTPTQQENYYTICSCQVNPITASCVHQYKKKIVFPSFTTLVNSARYEARSEL
ncbi:hypothetical protein Vadar_017702 [Vaccinium darrowii]|nr:hypothetical protein Vadar_017702 [Vaccinium darrowii]